MKNGSNNLRRTLCNLSGRNKDRNAAVCHSDRRAMREIENELNGTEQSIAIRNKITDRIINWYRNQLTDKCVFTKKGS